MREIMRKRYKKITAYSMVLQAFESRNPFYTIIRRDEKGKVVEHGIVNQENVEFILRKGHKLGIVPTEVWISHPLTFDECKQLTLKVLEEELPKIEEQKAGKVNG